jgi:uncharacterized membrane protein HdeD (DUF308 family)
MTEENKPEEVSKTTVVKSRPFLLSVLSVFSLVYFGILALLFLAGLFKTALITRVMNQYLPTGEYTTGQVTLIFGSAFILHGLAFAGILMMWRLSKKGYYILGIACLIIGALQLMNPASAVSATAIYIAITFLFGLFYTRLN